MTTCWKASRLSSGENTTLDTNKQGDVKQWATHGLNASYLSHPVRADDMVVCTLIGGLRSRKCANDKIKLQAHHDKSLAWECAACLDHNQKQLLVDGFADKIGKKSSRCGS